MIQQSQNKNIAAFTLIQMAIVLIVIGLIAGGVILGDQLREQAKVQRVYKEAINYQNMVASFKVKYNALPGDISNATEYFSACPAGNAPTGCNGNEDGKIGTSATDTTERFRFWQHLQFAQMLDTTVTGAIHTGPGSKIGVNIPQSSAFKNLGYGVTYEVNPGNSSFGDNLLVLGGDNPAANLVNINSTAIFTQDWTRDFDIKYDDGLPGTGNIIASHSYGHNNDGWCFSGNYLSSGATYYSSTDPSYSASENKCAVIFKGIN